MDTPSPTAPGTTNTPGATGNAPSLVINTSRQFTAWMLEQRLSLAFSTYQSGKLFLLGVTPEGKLSVFERTFNRAMGMWSDGQTLLLSTVYTLWRFENFLAPGELADQYDRLYVPKIGYTTGDIDIHDIVVEKSGRVLFVSTLFGCVGTYSDRYSFQPVWEAPFLSKRAAEDRCHLNGLCIDESGSARYATAVAETDVVNAWREHRRDGGVIIDLANDTVLCRGLSMPHSPRVYEGTLYVLNSGTGWFGKVNRETGEFTPITFCPGYARGLSFAGRYAIIGLSKPRHGGSFSGLELDETLAKQKVSARCGLLVVDLKTGDTVQWVELQGIVEELYDVVTLPGVIRPKALGFKTDEIARCLSMPPEE